MTVQLTNHDEYILQINYPDVDYIYWLNSEIEVDDDNLINILDNMLLFYLDCTRTCKGQYIITPNNPMYKRHQERYIYYLLKFRNQFLYNEYVDKLIQQDNINKEFHRNKEIFITESIPSKKKVVRKNQIPNKWFRAITQDLYTGEDLYIYENMRTKESFTSTNPNLLEELNAPKKKEKKQSSKVVSAPLSAMTFSFKKK